MGARRGTGAAPAESPPISGRFVIRVTAGPWDAERTARESLDRCAENGSVASILNTVGDAVEVYDRASRGQSACRVFLPYRNDVAWP